jgi:hypothetical protein
VQNKYDDPESSRLTEVIVHWLMLVVNVSICTVFFVSAWFTIQQHRENVVIRKFIQENHLAGLPVSKMTAVGVTNVLRRQFNTDEATFKKIDLQHRPLLRHDARTLLEAREGLCGEGTRVLICILGELGFNATRVGLYQQQFQVGHALAAIQIGGKDIFVDSIGSDDEINEAINENEIGPKDFAISSYSNDLTQLRTELASLANKNSNPFGPSYVAYSYEAIPYNRVASLMGLQVRVLNFKRPAALISYLVERPNTILAIFWAGVTILFLFTRSILYRYLTAKEAIHSRTTSGERIRKWWGSLVAQMSRSTASCD